MENSAIRGGCFPGRSDVILVHLRNIQRGAFQHLAHFTKSAVILWAPRQVWSISVNNSMLSPFEFAAKHKTSYKKGEQDRINSPSLLQKIKDNRIWRTIDLVNRKCFIYFLKSRIHYAVSQFGSQSTVSVVWFLNIFHRRYQPMPGLLVNTKDPSFFALNNYCI